MKRTIRIIALITALLICLTVPAYASDSYVALDGFTFDITAGRQAVIHSYDDRSADVTVPNDLLGAPVVKIDDYTFFCDTAITSVNFDQAQYLTAIGSCAFYGCSGLTSVDLPAQAALSFGSFQNCTELTTLTVGDGAETIPEQCFYGCRSLQEIALPDSVTQIGTRAFGNCTSLCYAYLPAAVQNIASNAFDGDSALIIRCEKDSYAARYAKSASIPVQHPYGYLLGDADGDGDVTIVDATVIMRVLVDLKDDADGMITLRGSTQQEDTLEITDATLIQRYLGQMDVFLPVGEAVSGYAFAENIPS